MVETFIRRPVLSLVISILIVLVGGLALFQLPVTQFPDIVPPSVTVTGTYTGANAETCVKAVATPLERAINGVPGMTYMQSTATNNGLTTVQVYFNVGTDPDLAAVNVQNRVSTTLDELPEEVIRAGVTTEKEVNSMLLYLNLTSTDPKATEKFIYNFADINVLNELKRIDGVGLVAIMGTRDYAMRVWLKPDRLLAYNLSAEEVVAAIRAQNVEAAPGRAGEASGRAAPVLQYVLRYTGKLNQPDQYRNLVIRANPDGSVLRLKAVADVEFGSLSYGMASRTDGRPSASIMIKQRPGSNARDVIAAVKSQMARMQKTSFPPGMEYSVAYDVSRFLDASINEVLRTLVEAFILVFIVVFIFLQDWRATLIPALAVPVALIGTLGFMLVAGFSLNLLTLFALVLAIGIVVDNAIVVVEAVHVKMHEEHLSALDATLAAMREITGAIIALTLVMSAVFIPVSFLSGPVGVFYRQFALTLAIAIVISGINALTLTPALCALLLREPEGAKKGLLGRVFGGFNRWYENLESRYQTLVRVVANRRVITLGALVLFVAATWGVGRVVPTGFIPTEDQATVYVNVTTPPGATVERAERVLEQVEAEVKKFGEVNSVTTLAGYSLMNDVAGASYGMAMIDLKDWSQRKAGVADLLPRFAAATRHITDADVQFFQPPAVPGFGNASGFEMRLLDRSGQGDLAKTARASKDFLQDLTQRPEMAGVATSFNATFPQYLLHVDTDVAAKRGVTVDQAMNTLQTLLGSTYATNFIRFGQLYKVMVQADARYRLKPDDVLALTVKNDRGEMVPYGAFVRLERVYGPEQLMRYNMYTSATFTGEPGAGRSTGDVIAAAEEAARKLPKGYGIEWSGMTREQILAGDQTLIVFAISLIFVYLLLAAQYESFALPLPVLLSLPVGAFGSLASLWAAGLENNIYAQVSLVMLIGLLGKNAILIIEIAEQRRKAGAAILDAAVEGARSRLRPILMTSLAFVAGLLPLVIASGAGAIGNRSIGTAAAGGMLVGTLFGVVLVPGLYVLFAPRGAAKPPAKPAPVAHPEPATA